MANSHQHSPKSRYCHHESQNWSYTSHLFLPFQSWKTANLPSTCLPLTIEYWTSHTPLHKIQWWTKHLKSPHQHWRSAWIYGETNTDVIFNFFHATNLSNLLGINYCCKYFPCISIIHVKILLRYQILVQCETFKRLELCCSINSAFILNKKKNCPELLSQIPLNVPQTNNRVSKTFYVRTYHNNYSQFALINRMFISGNSINNFDFFLLTI